MTVFDYLVLLIVATSLLLGMWRGVVGEIIALVAWVLAFFAAKWWGTRLAHWFTAISDPTLRIVAGWVAVFVARSGHHGAASPGRARPDQGAGNDSERSPPGTPLRCCPGPGDRLILVAVGGMTALPKEKWWSEAYFPPRSKRPFWPASPGCHPTSRNESGLGREKTMCGILGVVATTPVNQLLYDGLMVLQHRGQDAAGIVTAEDDAFHMHKGSGLVRDVFRTRNMRALPGNMGIAHCRYPTAGSAFDAALSQPFYVNSPFGIVLGHNGNLTNAEQLKEEMFRQDLRHINTSSDSEVLLNTLAHELQATAKGCRLDLDTIFAAVAAVHRRCRGAYAVVAMIAGHGLLAFRDPFGIRPLIFGTNETPEGIEYLFASESVALDTLGFQVLRDVAPGEAIFIDLDHRMHQRQCAQQCGTLAVHFRIRLSGAPGLGDRRRLGL
jgi:predicted glutamine amidotransferase